MLKLGKRSEDFTNGKRNISMPFRNMIILLLLLITLKQLGITLNGTILTFWRTVRLTFIVRSRRNEELQPELNANVSSVKLSFHFIGKALRLLLRSERSEGIRIPEFITSYQNALHLTRVHCTTFTRVQCATNNSRTSFRVDSSEND